MHDLLCIMGIIFYLNGIFTWISLPKLSMWSPKWKPVIMGVFLLSPGEKDGPKSLYELMADRQEQAEKSVLISCPSRTSEKKFLKFLSKHGDIKKHFFYESYVSINAYLPSR